MEGLLSVVFLATTLPDLYVVTVTLGATVVFLTALVAFVAVCEVLRVLLLRGALGAFAEMEAVDLTGIGIDPNVYNYNIT